MIAIGKLQLINFNQKKGKKLFRAADHPRPTQDPKNITDE